MSDYHVLVDSDAFVAWILEDDANHEKAKAHFERLMAERRRLVTTSFVIAETATVLSHLAGQAVVSATCDKVPKSAKLKVL